ncbi:nuclear transport factor 2 family protein [Nodosilinea sp. AN01ver1]
MDFWDGALALELSRTLAKGENMNLHQLTALEDIRQAKARYCRFIDLKQWDNLKNLFTPTVNLTFYGVQGELLYQFTDLQIFIDQTAAMLDNAQTIHQVHNPEIQLTSETTAQTIWSMEDWITYPEDVNGLFKTLHGFGHYYETLEFRKGCWLTTTLSLKRTILTIA